MAQARELGLHYIAAGTTRRRSSACRAAPASHVAQRFGVRHVFIDVPNPI